jgi:tol-pal system protein YbgF
LNKKLALTGLLGAAFLAAPLHCALAQTAVPSGPALTRIEERLNDMEQQIRALTNKVEQQQYATTQLQQGQTGQLGDVTRRIQDLEVRINTLGVGNAAPAPAGTTAPAAQSPAENPPPAVTNPAPVENKAAALDEPVASTVPVTTDPNAPIATAPTVKPLGEVKADGQAQPGTPEALYETAFALIKAEKYAEAEGAFKGFLKTHPNHSLSGNAQYWLGETYYARKQYKSAAKAFAEGYQKYRRAPKAADNLLKLALSLEALGSTEDACVTFQQFKNEYGDAPSSLKAKADAEIKKLACPAA